VNTETPIPFFIQNMTGITDDMVRDAPTFDELAGEVLDRLNGRLFIAHNAQFDYGFLKNEFRRVGHDFRATVLCTVKLSRRLFPEHRRHSLDALIERHGLRAEGRHRALADAQLIHQFWQMLRQSQPEDQMTALIKELTARPSLPVHLDPGIVDELPESPGVYLFYGENALPLYVGKAKDIKKRVLSHFAGDQALAKKVSLAQQVRRIDWIVTGGEIGAQLKESALIRQLHPSHNRHLRRNDELCAVAREAWPFPGPAWIREGEEVHVVDGWCYLGSAKAEDELWPLLEVVRSPFDCDTYRILAKAASRMMPLKKRESGLP
jgi:DNA polymerase-3 subunit epsilon